MASAPSDLSIIDLRGGMNNQDPKHILPDDQSVLAENIEYFVSTLGERRRGMVAVDLTASDLTAFDTIVHLGSYSPTIAPVIDTVLVAAAGTEGTGVGFAARVASVWAPLTATDAPAATVPDIYQMRSQGLHSKWFVAYKSDEDRSHVYDNVTIRRVGLAAPIDAPVVVDSGTSGSYTGERLFRVRVLIRVAGKPAVLSEPSPETTFSPDGSHNGAVITQPTLPGEGETDWVVEASDGDGNFYAIATLAIGTTTYTDTTQPKTDYANEGTLSADIGEYQFPPSVKVIKSDEDRALYIGSWTNPEYGSRVWWTPVFAAPGVGNDERVPATINSFADLDWQDGGPITDASDPINGSFYVFKAHRIYKGQRTGNAQNAYAFYLLDPSHGAVTGSVVTGVDEYGRAAIYFIDPAIGPMRVGSAGVQQLQGLIHTWQRVDTNASKVVAHGVYYPDKKQIRWWLAVDGNSSPTLMIVSQTNHIKSDNEGGTTRGWSQFTGLQATAFCSTVVPELVADTESGSSQLTFRPFMGYTSPDYLQVGDLTDIDNDTPYYAHLISKPYILAGLLNKWGAMTAALLASPNSDSDVKLTIRLIRDFGLETQEVITTFEPTASETEVIKVFDNLKLSDARTIQVEFIEVPDAP